MAVIELSKEQDMAITSVVCWSLDTSKSVVAIAGPAGSGKTTLIKELERALSMPVTVCATTNKAANILRRKGIEACTLHQACMLPVFNPPIDTIARYLTDQQTAQKINFPREMITEFGLAALIKAHGDVQRSGICSGLRSLGIKDVFKYIRAWLPKGPQDGALIADESSMMSSEGLEAAMQVYKFVICVGDGFQLPPVKSEPVFWQIQDTVNLEHIHRQAEGSQPLVLATKIRNGEDFSIDPVVALDFELSKQGMPVICWTNRTRINTTKRIRAKFGYYNQPPKLGEFLVCKNGSDRDAKNRGLINNTIWKVLDANGFNVTIEDEDGNQLEETIFMEELDAGDGVDFRFAYALTCHMAQGSEFDHVQIHAGDAAAHLRAHPNQVRQWLYTGVTRAKEQVLWVR